jgi:hypothetical protein
MTSAYHWEPIMDPGLTSVGYGTATYQDVFPGQTSTGGIGSAFTLVFNRTYSAPAKAIMWPPSSGAMPYTSYSGGETPNPLANCAGYATPTGAPLSLQLTAAPQVSTVTLTQAGVSGNLASCWFTGANVKFDANDQAWVSTGTSILNGARAVVIIPRQPLANGTYCVSVTNSGTPIQWSFTVGGSPTTTPAPCGSGTVATSTPTPAATGTGQLAANQGLNVNEQLLSPNGKTRLLMQSDGNLCLYRVDTGAYLWGTSTGGKSATHLLMQTDGNLVLYNSDNTAVYWSSGTQGHPGARLALRDDGNLVILDQNGAQLWASGTAWNAGAPVPTSTATPAPAGVVRLAANQELKATEQLLAANGKTRLVMQSDGNLVLYRVDNGGVLWASGTYGKPMTHVLMQPDGNFVGYNNTTTVAYWSSGTYGHSGASLVLRDDGNLLVVDQSGAQLWATGTSVN